MSDGVPAELARKLLEVEWKDGMDYPDAVEDEGEADLPGGFVDRIVPRVAIQLVHPGHWKVDAGEPPVLANLEDLLSGGFGILGSDADRPVEPLFPSEPFRLKPPIVGPRQCHRVFGIREERDHEQMVGKEDSVVDTDR